jgi:bifunctional UDP-N-acetylglucosamine pyrophosphorylase/glucosamine-1-phosphate N-acetyltransferase
MLKNKPLILHLLGEIEKINQLAKPLIVVGYRHKDVMAVLGEGYDYAFQERQLGTGHAVMSAEPNLFAENILVLYGDMPFIKAESIKKLILLHQSQKAELSMFTSRVPNFNGELASLNTYGRILRDSYGNIVKITEYKDATPEERGILEVNPGIYMFNTKWLVSNIHNIQNKNSQGEYYLTDMVELAIRDGRSVHGLEINPKEVLGVNTLEQLAIAESL